MSEPFLNEMSEELEGAEALNREMQELNEMTNEPGSYIEGKIDVAQSEAIESTFNELVNTAQEPAENLAENIPVPIPKEGPEGTTAAEPAENLAEVLPTPVPKEGPEVTSSTGQDVGGLPVPIPREANTVETGAATVEFNVAGEVSATFNGSTVSLIPENDAESPQGINPGPVFSETATEDSSPELIGENG